MWAQVTVRGQMYVVQALVTDRRGLMRWENVECTRSQSKARELMYHIQSSSYDSIEEIYKSEYYQEHF